MKPRYVKLTDFKQTSYRYNDAVSPSCNYSKYRGSVRITFRLPNNQRCFFYAIPTVVLTTEKASRDYLSEFEAVLRNGLFPKNAISYLSVQQTQSDKLSVVDAIEMYYSKFNFGKRRKSKATMGKERKTLTYLLTTYFVNIRGKKYVGDITSEDLLGFNNDIETFTNKQTEKILAVATVVSYKRWVKAFLNCMISYDKINKQSCDTSKIALQVYNKGKLDSQATARLIAIPQELIEAVKTCTYEGKSNLPDIKKLFLLYAETGLRKSELLMLSTHNLIPDVNNFTQIKVMDKHDCPTTYGEGFTVKTKNGNRSILLSNDSIKFIKDQIAKHKKTKVYGMIGKRNKQYELVEYPFLFPRYDYQLEVWLSIDRIADSFNSLLEKAIEEAKFKDSTKYKLHDLRRSLNLLWRRKGITPDTVAHGLGHSLEVNERNYLAIKDRQELMDQILYKELQKTFGYGAQS